VGLCGGLGVILVDFCRSEVINENVLL